MSQELLFVVDENDEPRPPLPRRDVIQKNLWRRTGGGMIVDKQMGTVLCHRRSDAKDERPGVWTALFGGKCGPNELPQDTAQRELTEELGIKVKAADLQLYTVYKASQRHQFEYMYWVYVDSSKQHVVFDPAEVAEVAWRKWDEVLTLLKNNPSWYSYDYDIPMLESLL